MSKLLNLDVLHKTAEEAFKFLEDKKLSKREKIILFDYCRDYLMSDMMTRLPKNEGK